MDIIVYFNKDITQIISSFLKRKDLIDFFHTSKQLWNFDYLFFQKFDICYQVIISYLINNLQYDFKLDLKQFANKVKRIKNVSNQLTQNFFDKFFTSVESIHFHDSYFLPIIYLPNTIKELYCGKYFTEQLNNLPESIIVLKLGKYFDGPINNLPKSIKHLTLGCYFNQPLDHLPNSITHLTFGNDFNQPLDHLPNSITHLTFGNEFNQSIDSLPDSIIWLKLGRYFEKRITKLPKFLKELHIFNRYRHKEDLVNYNIKILIGH